MPCRRKAKHKARHRLHAIKAGARPTGLILMKAPDEKTTAPQATAETKQPAAS